MSVEVVKTRPTSKSYLRVAAVSAQKEEEVFFYIGKNADVIDVLRQHFPLGHNTSSFASAKNAILFSSEEFRADAIFIDLQLTNKELSELNQVLRLHPQLCGAPVIYNSSMLENMDSIDSSLVDDVIDFSALKTDLTSKIRFLKKAKASSENCGPEMEKITVKRNFFKRAFDVFAATMLLLLTLPVFILIYIAIKLESRGPVFYTSKRAGRGFKIFEFYKFRTMEVNADQKIQELAHLNQYNNDGNNANFFKISNDPRITRIGKILRNSSLDELPQLINVLKGDMSLVGNRPLPLYEASTLTTNEFVERFMAPAGITGLWQIMKRGKAEMSVEERISLDISYARKSTLAYDMWIMVNTPKALFQKSDV